MTTGSNNANIKSMPLPRSLSRVILFGYLVLALGLVLTAAANATTVDITSQFAITRSGLGLNRTTNTFDQTVTLQNSSSVPILAPISVVLSGLPSAVTLANGNGETADGKPYVSPMAAGSFLQPQPQSGSALSFVLKFANPQRVTITYALQVLYTVPAPPPNAPTLISVVPSGVTNGVNNAFLIGRVDGAANQKITLQPSSASSCFLGTLVDGTPVGGTVTTMTDASGYFRVSVSGVNPGVFVSVQTTTPSASPMSACLFSSRDNDSWPKAFQLDGSPVSAQDFIDAPGKARWYKFSVTPGQHVQVSLTGLPADYTLAVFKDIDQAFLKFSPDSFSTESLLELTAEYAPSVWSPSVWSPSLFTPSVWSPSGFTPSVWSPSAFSPSVWSPSVWSPSVWPPSTFDPRNWPPPDPSVLSEIAKAFSAAQTRSVIGVSTTPGTGDKSVVVDSWNNTGNFYVRVTGRGEAFDTATPFTLMVTKFATACAGVTDTVITARSAALRLKTVILWDSSVVDPKESPLTPGGETLRQKLDAFAQRPDVNGVVIDVAGDERVQALKQQAARNAPCPFAVNLVAQEIKGIVDAYRSNPLQLQYVVIVGSDTSIPFFRSPDESGLGPESDYVPPVQSDSESEASLAANYVLSQDAYGSNTTISLPYNDFPVPGLAVGRLVETASEIAGVIDAYVATNGVVVPQSSLVTGYDFLAQDAKKVETELQRGTGTAPDELIAPRDASPEDPPSWTATDLANMLFHGSRHDVIFLAGHFSANNALAADFSTSLITTDLLASTQDFTNSIVFSAGCHSGYNLVDSVAIPGVTLPLDWPQAFARKKATLIAGTGYQYGDTDFIKYSERIYLNFSRELRTGYDPVPIGKALVAAKLDYLATTPDIRGIPEKALLESTLFGLPMLSVNMPAERLPGPGAGGITPAPVSPGPAQMLGLEIYDLTVDLKVEHPLTSHDNVNLTDVQSGANVTASWLGGDDDDVATKPGEPVLPLVAVNVTPNDPSHPGLVLRGIGLRSGSYVDEGPLLPFASAPTTEQSGLHVPFTSPVFYPGRMWSPNYFGRLAQPGGATELLVTPAQHIVADAAAGTSVRRKFTDLVLRLYYSDSGKLSGDLAPVALSEAPTIVSVDAQSDPGSVLFTVQVVGDPLAAIPEVWVTYTSDPANDGTGTWTSLELAQCVGAPPPDGCTSEDSRLWKGRLHGPPPANLQYMVQALNGVGLVSLDDNRGAYYAPKPPTPAATSVSLVAPSTATAGGTVNVTTKLSIAGVAPPPQVYETVTVSVGGIQQIGRTGTDGTVTLSLPLNIVPGTYQLTTSFAGDDKYNYQPSSTTKSLIVNQPASTLAPLATPLIGVMLTGEHGGRTEVLQQQPVSFAVRGPIGQVTIWSITDDLGQATLPRPGLLGGDYTLTRAFYGGNATYAPSFVDFLPPKQFTVQAVTLLDNTTSPTLPLVLDGTQLQLGNEVQVNGPGFKLTDLEIGVNQQGVAGTADLQAFLYANDGPGGTPGTLLWQSSIVNHVSLTGGNDLIAFAVPAVLVPSTFTWAIQISNGQPVAPALPEFDPPAIGSILGGWFGGPGQWTGSAAHNMARIQGYSTITLNFDSITLAAGSCTDASAYLATFGITFVPVSPGAASIICNESGTSSIPSSSPNDFYVVPSVTNTDVSADLLFTVPVRQVQLTRATVSPSTANPPWDACAYDTLNNLLGCVSEPEAFPGPVAKIFTLAGPGITRLHFDGFNHVGVTRNFPPIDDMVLTIGP
jgi:hypothetical protein